MLGTKRFLNYNNCFPKVLRDEGIVFKYTLKLVALGKLTAVDSTSPLSSRLALGCCDLWASHRWAFLRWRVMTSLVWCLYILETWAYSLQTIEDKSIWSSTWMSSLWWLGYILHSPTVGAKIFLSQMNGTLTFTLKGLLLCRRDFYCAEGSSLVVPCRSLQCVWVQKVNGLHAKDTPMLK